MKHRNVPPRPSSKRKHSPSRERWELVSEHENYQISSESATNPAFGTMPNPLKRSLSRRSYTVGLISALPLEMAAVIGMLDEAHEDCGKRLKDDNTYVIGHITGHNCVLACLPVGLYGTTSATSVATEMRFTFPLIEFWLLVGIRGGAPGAHADIRLGDAVVGIPSPGRDGVIPYDYGKTLAEGKFIQTASINKPPVAILTAVSKLQAGDRTKQQTSISEMVRI